MMSCGGVGGGVDLPRLPQGDGGHECHKNSITLVCYEYKSTYTNFKTDRRATLGR